MVEVTRHFTTTVYIVCEDKVLLHKHKKFDLILPVGGHLDRDELPCDCALREAKEEAGLDIELYNSNSIGENDFSESSELNRGEHLNLHNINEFHQHMDFVFFARSSSFDFKPKVGESKELSWFSYEEIKESNYLKENVKVYALEALEKLGKKN